MNFNIATFLKDDGFEQTQDSDKRDIFEKEYYHPFRQINCKIEITIYHNSGITSELSWSPILMSVLLKNGNGNQDIYEGLAPTKKGEATTLLKHIVPSLDELKRKEFPH